MQQLEELSTTKLWMNLLWRGNILAWILIWLSNLFRVLCVLLFGITDREMFRYISFWRILGSALYPGIFEEYWIEEEKKIDREIERLDIEILQGKENGR